MRAAWILIPLVLLGSSTPGATTDVNCSHGVVDDEICCAAECVMCGGIGCGTRVPHLGGDGCCGTNIKASGKSCSEYDAPCIMDDQGSTPTTPTPPNPTTSASSCGNGVTGIPTSEVCCPEECGTCGGSGCGDRGNHLTGDDCCVSQILASKTSCSVAGVPPCILDHDAPAATSPTPTPPTPTTSTSTCVNGLPGIQNSKVCCSEGCVTCGGTGCGSRGDSLTGDDCCESNILASQYYCSAVNHAPCILDSDSPESTPPAPTSPTPTPPTPNTFASSCGHGVLGIPTSKVCCPEECGTCGGSGCGTRGNDCCESTILASSSHCSVADRPPCILDEDVPTFSAPTPTTTITSPKPTPGRFDPVMPTPSPVTVNKIPTSCSSSKKRPSIRFADKTAFKGRLYMEGEGCATMTDLYESGLEPDGTPKGPVYVLDTNNNVVKTATTPTGKWLLTSELYVLRGAVFYCRGQNIEGDCDELRIQSTGSTDFHEIRGHGGSLYFENTVVTSWNTSKKKPQETHSKGRSFLNCISEIITGETCDGKAKNDYGWCRMDIVNSEMGYLGWFDSESYGLTWKVRGFCKDKSNPEVFDKNHVYGDIIDSDIHHMYYGMYSYGHQGGIWTGNEMHDNHQYGFDPHDDSDYVTIANNKVYNNVNHGIIASKRCDHLEVYGNEVYGGGSNAAGIFLHRSTDSARVYGNYVHDMKDAGIAVMESFDAEIYDNHFKNVEYGIRFSVGSSNNYVHHNTFEKCNKYGFYTYKGSDAPDTDNSVIKKKYSDGRPGENYFYDNEVTKTKQAVKIGHADFIEIKGNNFSGDDVFFEFTDAFGIIWSENSYPKDACYKNNDDDSTFRSASGLPPSC